MGTCVQSQPIHSGELPCLSLQQENLTKAKENKPQEDQIFNQVDDQQELLQEAQKEDAHEPPSEELPKFNPKEKFDVPLSQPASQINYETPQIVQNANCVITKKKAKRINIIKNDSLWDVVAADKKLLLEPIPELQLKQNPVTSVPIFDETQLNDENQQTHPIFGNNNQEESISVDSKDALQLDFAGKPPISQKQILLQSSRGEQMFMSFAPKPQQEIDPKEHLPRFEKAVSLDQYVIKIANEHVVKLLDQLEPLQENYVPEFLTLGPYIILASSDIYVGQWYQGLRQGFGKQVNDNGSFYEGQWLNDKMSGFGRLVYQNGDYYTGEFQEGMKQGKGLTVYNDGSTHDGKWVANQKEGECKEIAVDGSVFQGIYKKGQRDGPGRVDYQDGSIYIGDFTKGEIEGKGTQTWPDGRFYEGEWKQGMMHGQGKFQWDQQKMFIGEYKENMRCGHGEYHWPDGRVYKGQWKNGVMHGQGIMIDPDQTLHKGVWKKGEKQLDKKELAKLKKQKKSTSQSEVQQQKSQQQSKSQIVSSSQRQSKFGSQINEK